MKLFDWITQKPKKNQDSYNVADLWQQQQMVKKSVHAVQTKLLKLNQQHTTFPDHDHSEPQARRREIVKIFVNHEEYGLLAIGTLGLYDLSGVEPEIELFEVKPNVSLQPDGLKLDHDDKKLVHWREGEKPLVLHEDSEKKTGKNSKSKDKKELALDPAHIGAKLLKRSKLLDRLLHPLNYLSPRIPEQEEQQHAHGKKTKSLSRLFKKLVATAATTSKQITCETLRNSSSSNSSIETRANKPDQRRKNSRKSSHMLPRLSCISLQVEESDSEAEKESEDENEEDSEDSEMKDLMSEEKTTVAMSPSSSTNGCPACSASGDPNPGHQQTYAKDIKPEYWIRTDSDYVVLEL